MEDLSTDAIPNPSEQTPSSHSLFSTLFISIFSCFFSIGCCYFALFSISFRHGLINSANKIVEMQYECLKPIPSKFFLPSSCFIPCKTSTPIPDAKWSNAIIFSLESQYRNQGISLQYLDSDEYVSFSEKHYAIHASKAMFVNSSLISDKIGKIYDKNKNIIFGAPENIVFFNNESFSFEGYNENSTKKRKSSIIIKSLKNNITQKSSSQVYLINRTIMPEKATLQDDISSNPLEFGFSGVKRIVGIETIKRALITSSHPIPVSFQLPSQIFYKEINETSNMNQSKVKLIYDNIENHQSNLKKIESSKNEYFPCPFNQSKKCYKFILYPPSSILINKNINESDYDEHITSYGNPVVMALVGYNDNFLLPLNSTSFLKGGFIMKSVFMNNEHSREYFMNEITSYQEMKLCHDNSDPNSWPITTSLKCIEETNNADSCGSVEFECVNNIFCDTQMKYSYFGENNFIEWNKNKKPEIVKIDFPHNFLYYVIKPKLSYSRNQYCGYSFIPFKVVEEMYLKNPGPFTFDAVDIQVKWSTYSYYSQRTSSKKYTKLRDSTYKIENFNRRLPYDDIEL